MCGPEAVQTGHRSLEIRDERLIDRSSRRVADRDATSVTETRSNHHPELCVCVCVCAGHFCRSQNYYFSNNRAAVFFPVMIVAVS